MSLQKLEETIAILNSGSAVIFQPKGASDTYLLTANHVVTGSEKTGEGTPVVRKCSRLIKILGKWKEVDIEFGEISKGVNYFPHSEKDICILVIGRQADIHPLSRFEDIENDRENFLLSGYPSVRRIDKDISEWFRVHKEVTIMQEKAKGFFEADIPNVPSRNELVGISGGGIVRLENKRISLAGVQVKMVDAFEKEQLGRVDFSPLRCFDEIVSEYPDKLHLLEATIPSSAITSSFELGPSFRSHYIQYIKIEDDYIGRIYRDSTKTYSIFDFYEDRPNGKELGDIMAREEKIIILGNPGLGKSSELRKLAIDLWENGERIPIYKNLKNFTQTTLFEEYIGFDFQGIDNITLILDGLDEMPNIQDFLSKFENFIQKISFAKKSIKYVLSCRTNIYNSFNASITGFKPIFLQDLTPEEGLGLLHSKCGAVVDSLQFSSELKDFITNPFQIEILSDYINEHQSLPSNTADIWREFIERRLKIDRYEKLKKIVLNIPHIKSCSKRVALVNELMKSNTISEDNLLKVLKENTSDYDEFIKNPLLEKSYGSEDWYFEHRNVQEYFAATALIDNEFEVIKDFICIKGSERTHPSLFNTITFLLNLLDKDSVKFNALVDLISTNEPLQLFKADTNRIEHIRGRVFQSFFTKECIEKTLWINTTRGMRTQEIAYFANSKENYKFLSGVIEDSSLHFRATISALDILSYFTMDAIKPEELQDFFKGILMQEDRELNIKTHIISCIYGLELCKHNPELLDWLIGYFNEESDKAFRRAMLDLIDSMPSVDPYFSYIKDEFLLDNRISERRTTDDVIRGNSSMLAKIILKLEDPDHMVDIVSYFFSEKYNIRLEGELSRSLLDRLVYFMETDEDFIIRILKKTGKIRAFYRQNDFLEMLLLKSSNKLAIAQYMLEEQDFTVIRMLLAKIADEEICQLVRDVYNANPFDSREIEYFRNNLNNLRQNSAMAEYFNGLMVETGFTFNEAVFTSEAVEKSQLLRKEKVQENFNLLFDTEKLLEAIQHIFEQHGSPITWEGIVAIEQSWYEANTRLHEVDMQYNILRKFIRDYGTLSLEDFTTIFTQRELIRFETIRSKLTNKNREFTVSTVQQAQIEEWCHTVCGTIDFDTIIKVNTPSSLILTDDFRRMKLVLFFRERFGFTFPKGFLLNCIEFISISSPQGEGITFENLFVLIDDTQAFSERVTDNLLHKEILSSSLTRHIEYALEKKLTATYPKIKDYLSARREIYRGDTILEEYMVQRKDWDWLKTFCTDINSGKCWAAVAILMQRPGLMPFCIGIAEKYLEEKGDTYTSNAMEILFRDNQPKALSYFLGYLREGITISVDQSAYAAYDGVKDVAVIREIFAIIYGADYDRYSFSGANTLMTAYLSNIAKADFDWVRNILLEILSEVVAKADDTGIFYINNLLGMCENAYINSRSNPYLLNEALREAELLLSH